MKKPILIMFVAAMIGACDSGNNDQTGSTAEIYDALSESEKTAGVFTPEVMWKMGRVASETLSPDGTTVAYTVTRYSMKENKGQSVIFTVPFEGGEPTKLYVDGSDPKWSNDGERIYFTSSRSGDNQLWSMTKEGKDLKQITSVEGGIEAYGVAPTEDKLFYTKAVQVEKINSNDLYEDMDKSQAGIYDDLMVRHWNYWNEGKYMHIFVAEIVNGTTSGGYDIMEGEAWDAPMAPYFDAAEIAWSPDGVSLAYTCKKNKGVEYAVSTDSDIFVFNTEKRSTRNICKTDEPTDPRLKIMPQMGGYDKYPVFSPDGSMIAFRSMRRPGNESDKERLFVWSEKDGSLRDLTPDFDYNAMNVVWGGNESIYFISPIEATHQLCKVSVEGGDVRVITSGDHDINAVTIQGQSIVGEITKISQATELFALSPSDGEMRQLTFTNKEIYDNIKLGEVQKRMVTTTDGKQMLTWVILPPDFDPNKKYPTLLFCEGGPQSVVSQFWSYRWNFELMAAQGYVVVAPNRRGLPSFGSEWLDQISGDYSGQNIKDYLSAIDDVAKEPWCDKERLGAVGASYGGYSVFYLAGNHEGRFKAFIAHCGIFNFESMYGETEELWFVNNDYGGSYWDKTNATAMRSYANSPQKFVDKWDTPILIFTGENDYRIPYTQSLQAFTAARVRGIPSRLVVFHNEAHQVFKPQNSLVWNREFFGWLDKYLK